MSLVRGPRRVTKSSLLRQRQTSGVMASTVAVLPSPTPQPSFSPVAVVLPITNIGFQRPLLSRWSVEGFGGLCSPD